MPTHIRLELILIAILLPLVALFALWYVPLSIKAPQGFGADSEISPRFAPYLLATLMVLAMLGRLVQIANYAARGTLDAQVDDLDDIGSGQETRRGLVLNTATMIYCFVLVPAAGFYAASVVLVTYLVHRLGERRIWAALLVSLACALFTYLLFRELLSVRLPPGELYRYFGG